MSRANWFFVADIHGNHSNIIKYCRRPFMTQVEQDLCDMADRGTIPSQEIKISPESTKLMTDTIINSTNAVVAEQDILVHVGDLLWTPRDQIVERVREFRNRFRCQKIILVWGNHDDSLRDLYYLENYYRDQTRWGAASRELRRLFPEVYDQVLFNINGQKVFANHYPGRSWNSAHHGAWMVYGHVHDLFKNEDNGRFSPYEEAKLQEKAMDFFTRYYGTAEESTVRAFVEEIAPIIHGTDLTVDVGVDNRVRGNDVPFGTPWSISDLENYMAPKRAKFTARKQWYEQNRPKSSSK